MGSAAESSDGGGGGGGSWVIGRAGSSHIPDQDDVGVMMRTAASAVTNTSQVSCCPPTRLSVCLSVCLCIREAEGSR
jgi:hypothetical protein